MNLWKSKFSQLIGIFFGFLFFIYTPFSSRSVYEEITIIGRSIRIGISSTESDKEICHTLCSNYYIINAIFDSITNPIHLAFNNMTIFFEHSCYFEACFLFKFFVKYAQVIILYWLLGLSVTIKSSFSAEIFSFTVFAMEGNDAFTASVLWLVFSDNVPIQLGPSEVYAATAFNRNLNKHSFPVNTEKDLHFKTNPCQEQLLCIQACWQYFYFLKFYRIVTFFAHFFPY